MRIATVNLHFTSPQSGSFRLIWMKTMFSPSFQTHKWYELVPGSTQYQNKDWRSRPRPRKLRTPIFEIGNGIAGKKLAISGWFCRLPAFIENTAVCDVVHKGNPICSGYQRCLSILPRENSYFDTYYHLNNLINDVLGSSWFCILHIFKSLAAFEHLIEEWSIVHSLFFYYIRTVML